MVTLYRIQNNLKYLYRPPQGNSKTFLKYLDDTVSLIKKDNVDIFIMGDFNIDFLEKRDETIKKTESLINQWGCSKLISEVTRYDTQKNSCIDQIITNSDIVLSSGVADTNLSDHQLIFVQRKKCKMPTKKASFIGRSYRNYDENVFKNNLVEHDWREFFANEKPNIQWDIMLSKIIEVADEMCPVKTYNIKRFKDPWITPEKLEMIRDKDNALRKAKRSRKEMDWNVAKRLRNTCLSKIRKAKGDFVRNELNINKSDSKIFWKNIHDIIPKNNKNKNKIELIDQTTSKEISESDVSSYINTFFSNIGPKLAKNVNQEWKYEGHVSNNHLDDINTNNEEVMKLCKEIDTLKAACISNLSSTLIKDALIALNEQFVILLYNSFKTGIFPDAWKIATVIPLYKGGNRKEVGNFRPVSLLPLPSKIIEKIVHDRINTHLENLDLLDVKHGGFRKHHSTIHTIAN